MRILVNGDSNMCGEELEDRSLGISSQIAQILGAEINNLSVSGSSNDRIYDSTMNYVLTQPKPDFVLIGWSEMCRVQWFLDDVHSFGEFVEINNLGVGRRKYPAKYTRRLERWHEISNNLEFRTHLSYYWHERIYNLHKFLQSRYIKHLFFHSFHDFKVHDIKDQLDWSNCFMDPYNWDNTYTHWCANQGFKEITPGWYHYEPAGQRAWAERVVDHIRKYKII